MGMFCTTCNALSAKTCDLVIHEVGCTDEDWTVAGGRYSQAPVDKLLAEVRYWRTLARAELEWSGSGSGSREGVS